MDTDAKVPCKLTKSESTASEKSHSPWSSGIYAWHTRMARQRQKDGLCYVGRKNKQTPPITLSDMKLRSLGFVTGSSYLAQAGLESTMWPWQALNSWGSPSVLSSRHWDYRCVPPHLFIVSRFRVEGVSVSTRPVKRTHREHHSPWQETEVHCSGKQGGLGRWCDG